MAKRSEKWNSYLCLVNGALSSIFLDLSLKEAAPDRKRPELLYVFLDMCAPRPDGLSSREEFEVLRAIEEKLCAALKQACNSRFVGSMTGAGCREFYFYGDSGRRFEELVSGVLQRYPEYRYEVGMQRDAEWNQYLSVLFPTDEQMETIKNAGVLDALEKNGDVHSVPREVLHWVYFETDQQRSQYEAEAVALGFQIKDKSEGDGQRPFGICLARIDAVDYESINEVVLTLFRLARQFSAEYDGWETSVERTN